MPLYENDAKKFAKEIKNKMLDNNNVDINSIIEILKFSEKCRTLNVSIYDVIDELIILKKSDENL